MKIGAAKLRWVGRALHSFEFLVNKPIKTGVCTVQRTSANSAAKTH